MQNEIPKAHLVVQRARQATRRRKNATLAIAGELEDKSWKTLLADMRVTLRKWTTIPCKVHTVGRPGAAWKARNLVRRLALSKLSLGRRRLQLTHSS